MSEEAQWRGVLIAGLACGVVLMTGCGGGRSHGAEADAPGVAASAKSTREARPAPITRVPPSRVRTRPKHVVLAVAQLGEFRAVCGGRGRVVLSYTTSPLYSERLRVSAGGTTLDVNAFGTTFFSLVAPQRTVGREVVSQTPLVRLTLDADHEPAEVRARIQMRLAEARDGTKHCAATTLKATAVTIYH